MPALPLAADAETLSAVRPARASSVAELPMMQEWAYDFENNQFLVDENGLPYLVSRNEALKVWLFWAVTTQLKRWRANSSDYGTEIERFIGIPVTNAIRSSELKRTIREAIAICQYVKRIEHIELSIVEGIVTAEIRLQSVYNEGWVEISVEVR